MANEELNQLIKAARDAAFFIRSVDGYENSKIANDLSALAEKVEKQKLLAIGRLAARVVYRNAKKAVEQCVQADGAFFTVWACSNCLPDQFDDVNRCNQCGKPRR
jgi:hypothetical protein